MDAGRPAGAGFTLVECAVVCAVLAVLAAIAMPTYRSHELRAARLDGVHALTRVQIAQEQYRAAHGLYTTEFSALRGASPQSLQGRYVVGLELTGPEAYRATARAQGVQERDRDCQALTLDVRSGFAEPGPTPQCWNR